MSLDNFIPTVWAGSILRNLHKNLVYGQPGVVNRDYQGDIQQAGDTVNINNIGPVTVFDYVKNTNMADPEALTDGQTILTIDQSKGFNFQVDDIDMAQTKPKVMDEGTYEAGFALADVADAYIASKYVGVPAGNAIGSDAAPVIPTSATAYEYLVDLKTKLDEANVPRMNRWVVVAPWWEGLLLKDPRYVSFGTPNAVQAMRDGDLGAGPLNGQIGKAAGFAVLSSNSVPNVAGAKYKIIAGSTMAISFADQISKTEAYRPEKRFADALKGLHLYGAKLVRPNCLAVLTANKS